MTTWLYVIGFLAVASGADTGQAQEVERKLFRRLQPATTITTTVTATETQTTTTRTTTRIPSWSLAQLESIFGVTNKTELLIIFQDARAEVQAALDWRSNEFLCIEALSYAGEAIPDNLTAADPCIDVCTQNVSFQFQGVPVCPQVCRFQPTVPYYWCPNCTKPLINVTFNGSAIPDAEGIASCGAACDLNSSFSWCTWGFCNSNPELASKKSSWCRSAKFKMPVNWGAICGGITCGGGPFLVMCSISFYFERQTRRKGCQGAQFRRDLLAGTGKVLKSRASY